MDTAKIEHLLALIGSITMLASLLSPFLHKLSEYTATTIDDEAVAFLDGLLALCGRLGWHKPSATKS
jgi:hypothetical protein